MEMAILLCACRVPISPASQPGSPNHNALLYAPNLAIFCAVKIITPGPCYQNITSTVTHVFIPGSCILYPWLAYLETSSQQSK